MINTNISDNGKEILKILARRPGPRRVRKNALGFHGNNYKPLAAKKLIRFNWFRPDENRKSFWGFDITAPGLIVGKLLLKQDRSAKRRQKDADKSNPTYSWID